MCNFASDKTHEKSIKHKNKMETSTKEIPVLLITGYLGSGKTTLLNRLLANSKGLRFAVIVNDIGAVNIDADLIQREGVVNAADASLVALQNGCICCTLQEDLIEQVYQLLRMQCFDYIVIEASGVCDPAPIAQTLCTIPRLGENYNKYGRLRLDSIVTVVDALRMQDEFDGAAALAASRTGEDDIERLLIQQVEFCTKILLNKASDVSPEALGRIRKILHTLQPQAEIIPCDYADVDFSRLLDSREFRMGRVAASAGWLQELGKPVAEPENGHRHTGHEHHHPEGECHCGHCHSHAAAGSEVEEYGISTFVYYRRRPFSMNKFDYFITSRWPKQVIRAKGICYFSDEMDMTYVFEQAGTQKQLSQVGAWYAALPPEEIAAALEREPGLQADWDERYGDRMQKLVFIGRQLDVEALVHDLDFCLEEE